MVLIVLGNFMVTKSTYNLVLKVLKNPSIVAAIMTVAALRLESLKL